MPPTPRPTLPPLTAVRAFEAAARHLSFTRAAAELHVTQSAISHQVRTLEAWLGFPLFRRCNREIQLTGEGTTYLPSVRAALNKLLSLAGKLGAWDEAARTIEDGAASTEGELAATLWAKAAEIHENQRADLKRAIDAWRKVDENRTDDTLALAALDRLLALEGRVPELVKVIERRAELADDADMRLVLLHRSAALHEEVLGDKPNAIAAYKTALLPIWFDR